MNKPSTLAHLALAGSLAACGPSEDAAVARVGSHKITSAALKTFVEQLPDGLRIQASGDAARRRYLQDLIDRQLLLIEARAQGLDTTRSVRAKVQEVLDRRAFNLYRTRAITEKIEVSPEEVRRQFDEGGYSRERKLTAILVANREDVEAAIVLLDQGESFASIARSRSLDQTSAEKGGELGFVGPEMAQRLNIPLDVFLELPVGQVSQPLPAGGRWHLVRFTEDRQADFEKHRPTLESRLRRERLVQAEEEHLEDLGASFGLQVEAGGLSELVQAFRQKTPEVLTDSPTPLYSYDTGVVTVGTALEKLKRVNRFWGLSNDEEAIVTLRKTVLRPFLLAEAAKRAGIYEDVEVQRLRKERTESILLETLKSDIMRHIAVADEEARRYYDEHPEMFHHSEAVWVQEILLPTAEDAREVRRQLETGASYSQLSGRSLREGASGTGGEFHFHDLEKAKYPLLLAAISQAKQGELTGPVELGDGYSVFTVLRREGGGVEPYASAKRRARGLLRRRREHEALQSYMKTLQQTYADQIEIDESRLRSALPDELVGS